MVKKVSLFLVFSLFASFASFAQAQYNELLLKSSKINEELTEYRERWDEMHTISDAIDEEASVSLQQFTDHESAKPGYSAATFREDVEAIQDAAEDAYCTLWNRWHLPVPTEDNRFLSFNYVISRSYDPELPQLSPEQSMVAWVDTFMELRDTVQGDGDHAAALLGEANTLHNRVYLARQEIWGISISYVLDSGRIITLRNQEQEAFDAF